MSGPCPVRVRVTVVGAPGPVDVTARVGTIFYPFNEDGGAGLSDDQPLPLGAASPGVSDEASRSDHRHPMPSASDVGAATPASVTSAIADAKTELRGTAPANGDTLGELHDRIAVVEALGSLATDAELIAAVTALIGSADPSGDTLGELQALIGARLAKAANLADLSNPATARTNLGLGNVDDTSDADKPVSTATQAALDLKAPLARTIAGLDLSADRTAAALRGALGTGTPGSGNFLRGDGSWAAAGGSVATDAIFDAKGDLPVGTGADTAAKLAVGVPGQRLSADASATTGLRYGEPAEVYCPVGYDTFGAGFSGSSTGSSTIGSTPVICAYFGYLPPGMTFDQFAAPITTLGSGATLRYGIYNVGSNHLPSTLAFAHSGTIPATSTGRQSASVTGVGFGWCWFVFQTGGAVNVVTSMLTIRPRLPHDPLSTVTNSMLYIVRADSALPSDLSSSSGSWIASASTPLAVMLRRS